MIYTGYNETKEKAIFFGTYIHMTKQINKLMDKIDKAKKDCYYCKAPRYSDRRDPTADKVIAIEQSTKKNRAEIQKLIERQDAVLACIKRLPTEDMRDAMIARYCYGKDVECKEAFRLAQPTVHELSLVVKPYARYLF